MSRMADRDPAVRGEGASGGRRAACEAVAAWSTARRSRTVRSTSVSTVRCGTGALRAVALRDLAERQFDGHPFAACRGLARAERRGWVEQRTGARAEGREVHGGGGDAGRGGSRRGAAAQGGPDALAGAVGHVAVGGAGARRGGLPGVSCGRDTGPVRRVRPLADGPGRPGPAGPRQGRPAADRAAVVSPLVLGLTHRGAGHAALVHGGRPGAYLRQPIGVVIGFLEVREVVS